MADDLLTESLLSWLRDLVLRLPAPRDATDGFATATFVRRLAGEAGSALADDDAAILERLSKKVEVVRRLSAVYAPDLSTVVDRSPVSADVAVALCGVYLATAFQRRDLKWLNTSLKMLDGCLKQPRPRYPRCLRQWAGQALVNWPWPGAD